MTIASTNTRNDYVAAGSCTFAYTFQISASTSLQVYTCGTLITTGYTVSGAGNASGGTVTFGTTPTSGTTVSLVLNEPYTQGVDFQQNSSVDLDVLEGALDKNTILAQQARAAAIATLHFGTGSPHAGSGATVADLQGGKLLRVGDDCDTIDMVDVASISPSSVTVPISIVNGGTGAITKATARANLDAAPLTAPYFMLGTNTETTCERNLVLVGFRIVDAGCGSTYTVTGCTRGISQTWRNASFSCTSGAATQSTQVTLGASRLALESSCMELVFVNRPNNTTNDISTDNTNKRNGRDQSGAFSAGDLHLYWVYENGSAFTRSSSAAPPTGPTLLACESHWAYSHSVVYDGSALLAHRVAGRTVYYDCGRSVLVGGNATCTTRVNLSSVVPAIAEEVLLQVHVRVQGGGAADDRVLIQSRLNCVTYTLAALSSGTANTGYAGLLFLPNNNQEFYYRVATAGTASQLDSCVVGYTVPAGP